MAETAETVLERPVDVVLRTRSLGINKAEQQEVLKPRIVIRHLVLLNFKSYAGRQEVGPFHSSFSSVVGPNGSGKSNVIDSLLFVFGFRASKMRQGKISALIHNSARYPNLDFCEVEVHFEEVLDLPDGTHESVRDSKLIVSRKAFKNNASKYYLNGKESTFTAITTLLRDRGIDLDHKRFLILQGEVESIAQMKPKAAGEHDDGLLEYLEDIIGTSKYKTPIDESAAEVDTLNELCVEKSSRVQHVEKEKNGLEDKKDKALAYVRDENELACKQSALYQIYIEDCSDNLRVAEEVLRQTQAHLDEELQRHRGSEDEISRVEKAYRRGKEAHDALERSTQVALKELAKTERETIKFDEKKKFLAGKLKKLEKALQASLLASSEADSRIQKHNDDLVRTTDEISSLEEAVKAEAQELARIRDGLTGKTQDFSAKIAEKRKQLEPWLEKISQQESAIAVTQSELDILRERASAGEVAFKRLREKVAHIERDRTAKHAWINEAKHRRAELETEVRKVDAALQTMRQREPDLRTQVSTARQKADEARANLTSSQSQSNVLKGLLRMKESGRIEGFHGRLGSLGVIDDKYDVAISTACPALENMVVDTVDAGQQCIDYLRQNSMGRANFILLDRLVRRDLSIPETPEGMPRLFDLVRPKADAFQPAFFSVLQNTLVADNLEQANRIAWGTRRWRVVTLNGQLIDASGTMSGGGTHVARGGMSSKLAVDISREQIARLETDRDSVEQQLASFQEEHRTLEARSKSLASDIPSLETQIQKAALEVDSCARHLADAEKSMTELSTSEENPRLDDTQIRSLEKKLTSHEEERDRLRAQTSGIEADVKHLQDKIMEVGGVKLRGQKAKVDGLKERMKTLSDENSSAEVSKSKATKDKAKHETAYAKAVQDLTALSIETEKLEDERKAQVLCASQARHGASEAQTRLEQKQDELEGMKNDLEAKTSELNKTRAVEIEMRNKLEETGKASIENQKRLRYWDEKLSRLALHSLK